MNHLPFIYDASIGPTLYCRTYTIVDKPCGMENDHQPQPRDLKAISLALGGGGAKGLAHIPMLEVIDRLDVPVQCLSGTSIGALIGVFYAAGLEAKEVRELITELLTVRKTDWKSLSESTQGRKWYQLVGLKMAGSGMLKLDRLVEFMEKNLPVKTFEELSIPMQIVASDFWSRHPYVFTGGDLITAIRASVSIAGLFEPVVFEDKVLVDGGAVNPVPFDLLPKDSLKVAIDVLGHKTPKQGQFVPSLFESMFNTYQIMEETIVKEKLLKTPPEIYIKPSIHNVRVLEFHRFEEILLLSQPAAQDLEEQLRNQLRL